MTNRSTSADFVTAFATGWPEQQPDIMVLSLTTHKGVQDFAFNKEQALLDRKNHQGNRGEAGETRDELRAANTHAKTAIARARGRFGIATADHSCAAERLFR